MKFKAALAKEAFRFTGGLVLILMCSAFALQATAQSSANKQKDDAAYEQVVMQRAAKIVAALELEDSSRKIKVQKLIARQYSNLNNIHSGRDAKIKAAKSVTGAGKEEIAASVRSIEEKAGRQINKLHKKYIRQLSGSLTDEQVVKVKDGMTYNVVPITYNGYMQMLPNLTEEQKKQIMAYLVEAREIAMDAETSEKKHAWFGKYKGRINNYLSAAGINMKKAGEEWEKRLKAERAASSN